MWGRLVGLTYWLLYDLILSLCICSNHAVCWLLLAGLVCYIFTVSVMINFLGASCSLKEPSFASASLNRAASCLIQLSLLHYFTCFISHILPFILNVISHFVLFSPTNLTESDVSVLQWFIGKYELFIWSSMLLRTAALAPRSNKLAPFFLTVRHVLHVLYVCTCIDYTLTMLI